MTLVAGMPSTMQPSPQSHQQSMHQPAAAGGQQQMTGGYQSQPGMAPNGVGVPGGSALDQGLERRARLRHAFYNACLRPRRSR